MTRMNCNCCVLMDLVKRVHGCGPVGCVPLELIV